MNYLHIYGWRTHEDMEVDDELSTAVHIDSVAQHGPWESIVQETVSENTDLYVSIVVRDDEDIEYPELISGEV